MAGAATNLVLLALLIGAAIVGVFGPLTALSVMFWHWRKELLETARLRQARSTQVR
jgi:O-antigen/teichoic acid export membrane protein